MSTARIGFCVVARDKAPYVARTVRAVLAQACEPIDIWLSDQGSTDGTRQIMQQVAQGYNGPHKVRLLDCPDTDQRGMPGLNAHYNWLHGALPNEFVAYTAADDVPDVTRIARTLEVLEQHQPDYIGTMQRNYDAGGVYTGDTMHPEEGGWCALEDIVTKNLGGSMSSAWSKKVFEQNGPLFTAAVQDLIVPFWAGLGAGMYYIKEPLHFRIHVRDVNNTGLDGLRKARRSDEGRMQVEEMINYQFCANWAHMIQKLHDRHADEVAAMPIFNELFGRMLGQNRQWAITRDWLTQRGVQPACFSTRKGLQP